MCTYPDRFSTLYHIVDDISARKVQISSSHIVSDFTYASAASIWSSAIICNNDRNIIAKSTELQDKKVTVKHLTCGIS
jgi:hypothetical protein